MGPICTGEDAVTYISDVTCYINIHIEDLTSYVYLQVNVKNVNVSSIKANQIKMSEIFGWCLHMEFIVLQYVAVFTVILILQS